MQALNKTQKNIHISLIGLMKRLANRQKIIQTVSAKHGNKILRRERGISKKKMQKKNELRLPPSSNVLGKSENAHPGR
jgi:hypothetical protein